MPATITHTRTFLFRLVSFLLCLSLSFTSTFILSSRHVAISRSAVTKQDFLPSSHELQFLPWIIFREKTPVFLFHRGFPSNRAYARYYSYCRVSSIFYWLFQSDSQVRFGWESNTGINSWQEWHHRFNRGGKYRYIHVFIHGLSV